MSRRDYNSKLSERYEGLEEYKKFQKLKEKLKQSYPPQVFDTSDKEIPIDIWRRYNNQYMRQVCDKLFEPNGEYQKLTWKLDEKDEE